MKSFLYFFPMAVLGLASCTQMSLTKTSKTAEVGSQMQSVTVADLKVGERVTETLQVTPEVARGGMENVKHAVEANALVKAGNADVLLEPQYTITKQRKFLTSKVTSITVTGLPAKYTNFRSLPDSVWANPVFRGYRNGGHGVYGGRSVLAAYKSHKTFKQPKADRSEKVWRKPGFAGHVAISGGLSVYNSYEKLGYYDEYEDKFTSGDFGLLADIGWQMNNYLYVGLGSGVIFGENWGDYFDGDSYESAICEFNRVPFYLSGRYHFSGGARKSAFADLKLGFTFCPSYSSFDNGVFFSPTLGYSIGAFDIGLSYIFTTLNCDKKVNDEEDFHFRKHHNNLHLTLGFTF